MKCLILIIPTSLFIGWILFMRCIGAFKTKKEIMNQLHYTCPSCDEWIYWNKDYPISNRNCPNCGGIF